MILLLRLQALRIQEAITRMDLLRTHFDHIMANLMLRKACADLSTAMMADAENKVR